MAKTQGKTQGKPPAKTQAKTHKVQIKEMKFIPQTVAAAKGDTVEWTNTMGMQHTVTPDNDEFEGSGPLGKDKTFSHTFDAAGTVAYHCEIHPFMKGTIEVT